MSASGIAIIGLAVAIMGLGVRAVAAFKPPQSLRFRNILGNCGYVCIVVGGGLLVGLAWHLYSPLTLQSPLVWNTPRVAVSGKSQTTPAEGNSGQQLAQTAATPNQVASMQRPLEHRITIDEALDFLDGLRDLGGCSGNIPCTIPVTIRAARENQLIADELE